MLYALLSLICTLETNLFFFQRFITYRFVHLIIIIIIIIRTESYSHNVGKWNSSICLKVLQKDVVTGISVMTATVVLSVLQLIVVILVVIIAVIKMIIVCIFVIASMTSPALPAAAAVVTVTPHLSHQHL